MHAELDKTSLALAKRLLEPIRADVHVVGIRVGIERRQRVIARIRTAVVVALDAPTTCTRRRCGRRRRCGLLNHDDDDNTLLLIISYLYILYIISNNRRNKYIIYIVYYIIN